MSQGTTTVEQAIQIAMQHHRAGQLSAAEAIYRHILAKYPNHPDALHLLGIIAIDAGQPAAGVELIRRAIGVNPNMPDYHSNLGNALRDMGQYAEAIASHQAALRLKPDYAEVHYNLANALNKAGRIPEAIVAYRQAILLKPHLPAPHNNLGNALYVSGNIDEAIAACREALRLDPNYAEAYFNVGIILHSQKRFEEAITFLRDAVRLKPNFAEAHYNLANSLHDAGQFDEAIAAYRVALHLKPDYPEAHNNLGIALRDSGKLDDANAAYLEALRIKPDYAPIHWNLGLNYLLQGNFKAGWTEHEWRWKCEAFPSPYRNFPQPMWDGGDLNGQTILLHAEQGFGDTIQFVRYVPMVVARGGRVILQCQSELARLLKCNPELGQIVSAGEPLPPFDVHCPLLSLPLAFRTDLGSIPGSNPYLKIDPQLIDQWKMRLTPKSGALRVGLVWAGSAIHKRDRQRSIALSQFLPLASISNVEFYSLQKGPAADQAGGLSEKMKLIDLSAEIQDFADTAALISQLDLVIGVDTAVIHLAAALGKPAWLVLASVPDWRWLMRREDSPWYSTIRLFRQSSCGDWQEVFNRVASALGVESQRGSS